MILTNYFLLDPGKISVDKNATFSDVRKEVSELINLYLFFIFLVKHLVMKDRLMDGNDKKWPTIGKDYSDENLDQGLGLQNFSFFCFLQFSVISWW